MGAYRAHQQFGAGLLVSVFLWLSIGPYLDIVPFGDRPSKSLEFLLAIIGCVFAVLATYDAHRAFIKAREVQEAIGSFRFGFEAVLKELIALVASASERVVMLVPTPAYGYLFGHPRLSEELVNTIDLFLAGDSKRRLTVCLVLGDRDATAPRHLIPQQYISRAHKLKSGGDRDIVDGYTKLIYRFFSMLSARAPQVELSVLASDPNVRIIVIDAGDDERAKCLLSFAPSQVLDISHEFDSVGFMSRRKEMVAAAGKLWEFYATEKGRAVPMPDYDRYRSLFTTLQ